MGLTAGRADAAGAAHPLLGPACAVFGVLGFSFKAILIRLAYGWDPVDAITLLTLRMICSAPFFLLMAWWGSRDRQRPPIGRHDWRTIVALGFVGYYLASLLDFMGLVHITASLERLVLYLYPTMVVLLSALLLGTPVTRRAIAALALSYAGIALVFLHDRGAGGDPAALWTGGALVFGSALLYAIYLVYAGGIIARVGSMRFIAWAMLASTAFVGTQFALTHPLAALAVPPRIWLLALAMAVFSTVLPTWLIAESIRLVGANAASLIGSLGPVFTIGLGALILGEPITAVQLAGAALVLVGVTLVTLRRRAAPLPPAAD